MKQFLPDGFKARMEVEVVAKRIPQCEGWGKLPELSIEDMRAALRTFPWATAVGLSGIHPRSIATISDAGIETMTALLTKCEDLVEWPAERIVTTLVRLPKPEGGARLIGLMHTPVRARGRARRPVSSRWEEANKAKEVWGVGERASELQRSFQP